MDYIIYQTKPFSNLLEYAHLETVLQWWKGEWIVNVYSIPRNEHFQKRHHQTKEAADKDYASRQLIINQP